MAKGDPQLSGSHPSSTLNRVLSCLRPFLSTCSLASVFSILLRIVWFALLLCVLVGLEALILHPCRFHRLGQWSIGVAFGTSPISFELPTTPTLSCLDVTDCPAAFVADPFLFRPNASSRWYLFFEVMNEKTDQGDIGVAFSDSPIQPNAIWSYQQIVLDEPFHLSYPFVFEHHGEIFMVPETYQAKAVRLYRATKFPTEWQFVRNLLEGDGYIDSSLIFHDGLWYMWTFTQPSTLQLFVSNTLNDAFRQHPSSPLYQGNLRLSRPGGRPIKYNGEILRYAQDCSGLYGERSIALRVTTLTSQHYQEQELATINPERAYPWISQRIHHVDPHLVGDDLWMISIDGNNTRHRDVTVFVWSVILAVLVWAGMEMFLGKSCYHRLYSALYTQFGSGYSLLPMSVPLNTASIPASTKHRYLRIVLLLTVAGMMFSLVRLQSDSSVTVRDTQVALPEPKDAHDLQRPCSVTLVMAMFDIGRETSGGESRKWQTYKEYFSQVLQLDTCAVVRVNALDVDFVMSQRKGMEHQTHVIADAVSNMKTNKYYATIKDIIDHPPEGFLSVRPGRPEKKIVEYNVIMYSKIDWLLQAVEENRFNSSAFFWIDAGYGHGLYFDQFRGMRWPNPTKLQRYLPENQIINVKIKDFIVNHRIIFAGGFFGGFAEPVKRAHRLYHEALSSELEDRQMDDDQTPWLHAYCKDPDLIRPITCETPFIPFALYCHVVGQQPCMTHRRYNCPANIFAP